MQIGELAERLGVTTKAIRFYESTGLLPAPSRAPSGYRLYQEADAERLVFIKTAQRVGLSLAEIREIIALRDRGEVPCDYVAEILRRQVTDLDTRIRELRALRNELKQLQASAAHRDPSESAASRYCGVIEHHASPPDGVRGHLRDSQ